MVQTFFKWQRHLLLKCCYLVCFAILCDELMAQNNAKMLNLKGKVTYQACQLYNKQHNTCHMLSFAFDARS